MKFDEIKVGDKVYDTGAVWVVLKVTKKLKTRIHVETSIGGFRVYDKAHCQFLRRY